MAKILIADDDPDFVLVTRTILIKEGYQVLTAANGRQALEMMRRDRPDLVLLDVMMSTTLEGMNVSKEMDSDPELSDVPVIMVSSIATTAYASDFPDDEHVPVEAWLTKPVRPAVLLRTIERLVE